MGSSRRGNSNCQSLIKMKIKCGNFAGTMVQIRLAARFERLKRFLRLELDFSVQNSKGLNFKLIKLNQQSAAYYQAIESRPVGCLDGDAGRRAPNSKDFQAIEKRSLKRRAGSDIPNIPNDSRCGPI